jgi:hypothetical protein
MSQDFRRRYEQLRASDPTKPESASEATASGSYYETTGHGRNLCLLWPDGRRMFLSYAYLVSGEFTVDGDTNTITLQFSLHTVTLRGYVLEVLFMALLDHLPRLLSVSDPRYADSNGQDPTILDIAVVNNES